MRGAPLRVALFALLAVNALVYAAAGRLSEGFDALAWYALLLLYECETRWPLRMRREPVATVAGLLRLFAGAAVVYAAVAFVHEREWLDALNAWLWIGVVIVLELEIRLASRVARHARLVTRVSYALYAALAGVALTWLLRGEWFDAWDAALWIAAFALIELELMPGPQNRRDLPGG